MRRRRLLVTPSRPLTPSLHGKEGETMRLKKSNSEAV